MPSCNPCMTAARWAAAKSTRACHSSALHSSRVTGDTCSCISVLLGEPGAAQCASPATVASWRCRRKVCYARLTRGQSRALQVLAQHLVFLEPVRHLPPGVLGGILAVARSIIGMETVRGLRINLEVRRLASGLECRLHRLHLRHWDTLVGLAVKAEDRRLHLRRQLGRALWPDRLLRRRIEQRAVKGHARLYI